MYGLDPLTLPDAPFRVPDWWSSQRRVDAALWLARIDTLAPDVVALARWAEPFAGSEARARAALLAVQSRPFTRDPPGEWLARGRVTAARGGDCLRLAPLVVVVAESVGVPGEVLWLSIPDAAEDHVTARLWVGDRWQWAEPTVRGARLGESPFAARDRLRAGV